MWLSIRQALLCVLFVFAGVARLDKTGLATFSWRL